MRDRPAVILRSPQGHEESRCGLLSWPWSKARCFAALSMTSFALLFLMAPSARAAGIDLTVSLDATDGLARIGYYVPVTLEATNHAERAVAEVHVSTGGPVDTRSAWFLAAGDSGETVVPVFYAGGDLALEVAFRDKGGGEIARLRPDPPDVRAVGDDTALVWLDADRWEPDEEELEAVRRALEVSRLQILHRDSMASLSAMRCQLVDAFPFPVPDSGGQPGLTPMLSPTSPIRTAVKPDAYAMLRPGGSAGADPARLWLWLALLTGVVVVICVVVPRRRSAWAAVAMAVLGLAAAGGVWLAAGGASARLREARFVTRSRRARPSPPERFVLLQARGGATARFPIPQERIPWPRPVFRSADEMYRPAGVLVIEEHVPAMPPRASEDSPTRVEPPRAAFETKRAACLLHMFFRPSSDLRPDRKKPTPEALAEVADRPDVVAALLVKAGRATDAAGRTQPLDAWAVEWKSSEEADLAWAGRSLAWWDAHRRTGDGPRVVAWVRDPAPEPPAGIDVYERLPAMVVCGE